MSYKSFKQILKSRSFKTLNRLEQTHILIFTEIHLIKDGEHLCDYDITSRENDFLITFSNLRQNVFTDDFQNVLLKCDDIRQNININSVTFKGDYNIILEGQ